MKEFKGTKGPWKTVESQSGKRNINIIGTTLGGKYKIARVPFIVEEVKNDSYIDRLNERNFLEAQNDAKLIAAAPDLLEALQDMWSHYEKHGQILTWDVSIAKRAIDKALDTF